MRDAAITATHFNSTIVRLRGTKRGGRRLDDYISIQLLYD